MRETIIYIISIGLQLSGAIILLIGSVSTKRASIIKQFAGKGIIHRDNNTNELVYNKDAFRQEYKKAILNKFAFGILSIGYLLGIWGEMKFLKKELIMLLVVIVTIAIIGTCYSVSCIVSRKCSNKVITNEELLKLNIEPDIENIYNEEIDKICK